MFKVFSLKFRGWRSEKRPAAVVKGGKRWKRDFGIDRGPWAQFKSKTISLHAQAQP